MGNSFSNKQFEIVNIHEALIDNQVAEIAQILDDPVKCALLNNNIRKKSELGRSVLHEVD